MHTPDLGFIHIITDVPGVARGKTREKIFNFEEKIISIFSRATYGFPQKVSANLVQPFGQL